jgi:hypothetical protein
MLVVFVIMSHQCMVMNHLKLQSNTFSYWTGKGGSSPGLKQGGNESDRSSPPSTEFQNAWIYIPTSPFDFMACVGTTFTPIITWRNNFLFEKLCVTHSVNKLFILYRPECRHCLHYNPTVNTVALLTLTVYSFKTYQIYPCVYSSFCHLPRGFATELAFAFINNPIQYAPYSTLFLRHSNTHCTHAHENSWYAATLFTQYMFMFYKLFYQWF